MIDAIDRPASLLICDVDNTLFDWNIFYARAFRALVHSVSGKYGIAEAQLYAEMKGVLAYHRSIEYPFLVQELASFRHFRDDEMKSLIKTARGAFLASRRRRMRPHAGVKATLDWVSRQGIPVVAVSNGPIYQTSLKLRELQLTRYFDGLVAWEGFTPPESHDTFIGEFITTRRGGEEMSWSATVKFECLKPSTYPYELVLQKYEVPPSEVWVVGDSLGSDIQPGETLGLQTVWAKYGTEVEPGDLDTLLAITDWSDAQLRALKQPPAVTPRFTIESFGELEQLLPGREEALFPITELI